LIASRWMFKWSWGASRWNRGRDDPDPAAGLSAILDGQDGLDDQILLGADIRQGQFWLARPWVSAPDETSSDISIQIAPFLTRTRSTAGGVRSTVIVCSP
jgi:hypothetical protein